MPLVSFPLHFTTIYIHAARCLFIKPQSYSSVNKVHLEPSRVTLGRCTLYMVHPLFLLPVFFAMTIFFARGQPQKILCPMSMYSDLKWHTWMRQPRTDCSDITIIASGHWVVVWRVPYLMIIIIILMTLMIMRTMRTQIPKFNLMISLIWPWQ